MLFLNRNTIESIYEILGCNEDPDLISKIMQIFGLIQNYTAQNEFRSSETEI